MLKAINRTRIKIVLATSFTLVTLLTTFSGTYAWFQLVRETSQEVGNFIVTASSDKGCNLTSIRLIKFVYFDDEFMGKDYLNPENGWVEAFDYSDTYNSFGKMVDSKWEFV